MNAVLVAQSYAGPGTLAAIGTTYILPKVGFCAAGVKAGSIAAGLQTSVYGAAVPTGGLFATLQSWGMTGALAGTLGAAGLPVGIIVAGGTYLTGKALGRQGNRETTAQIKIALMRTDRADATILNSQSKYEQAEEMHRQVVGLRETVLEKEHPDTLTSINNLAEVLSDQGKYEQAEEMYRQVVGLMETVLGKEHPSTLTSMNNLASILWNQDRLDEASELEMRVLETRIRLLGSAHPATLGSMANLAYARKSQGRDEDAINLMKEAARLRESSGFDHPDTMNTTLDKWLAEIETSEGSEPRASEEVLPLTTDYQSCDY